MFRIVSVSATRLQGKYHGRSSKLHKTIRYYSKGQQRSELCPPPPPKKTNTGTVFTIGALALASGAIIGYAKYDPDFRCVLTDYLPFTDDVIKFVFQEEKSYAQSMTDTYNSLKASIFPAEKEGEKEKKKKRKVIADIEKEYSSPKPVLPAIVKDIKDPEQQYNEIRLETKEKGKADPHVEIVDQKLPIELPEAHPKNLAEIERSASEAAENAVNSYTKALNALRKYAALVEETVEESVDRINPQIWESLKEQTAIRDETVALSEQEAHKATRHFKKLTDLLSKNDFGVPEGVKEQAMMNMTTITNDIAQAKKDLENEKKKADITEKYWKKVEAARSLFSEELEALFPTINLRQKEINIEAGDLDLFVLHAMAKVLYYQKEMHKLETLASERLRIAIETAKRGGVDVLSTEKLCQELEKEKRQLEDEFQKKCLKLRQEGENDLRKQLKMQSEAFSDHLKDAMIVREAEIEKNLTRNFDEKLTEERCRFKEQVAGMLGRLRGLDYALKTRAEVDKTAHNAQILWAACQSLFRAVKSGCPGLPWTEQLRPLDPEIKAVTQAAADNDELVQAVINGIPLAAKNRGVFPEDALRERFIKVEKIARGLALVPEAGGRLHLYLLSYMQSFLLLKAVNPIPQSELNDEETDFSKLSTNDILERARYWIDRGDFSQTLKYMNLLQGAPRAVSRQWMEETRIMLETQQAAHTLMAHATASGLLHL